LLLERTQSNDVQKVSVVSFTNGALAIFDVLVECAHVEKMLRIERRRQEQTRANQKHKAIIKIGAVIVPADPGYAIAQHRAYMKRCLPLIREYRHDDYMLRRTTICRHLRKNMCGGSHKIEYVRNVTSTLGGLDWNVAQAPEVHVAPPQCSTMLSVELRECPGERPLVPHNDPKLRLLDTARGGLPKDGGEVQRMTVCKVGKSGKFYYHAFYEMLVPSQWIRQVYAE
jgi:hypothetical protein